MEQWIDIAGKFGIPVALLLLAGWFLAKKVWPFVVEQIKEAQTQRQAETAKFVETIRTRDVLMAESQRENLKALEAMTVEIRGLRDEIRNGHKK
jgi:hypothetical protein